MGPISHLRNQFNSVNTFAQSYDYIIDRQMNRWKTGDQKNLTDLSAQVIQLK